MEKLKGVLFILGIWLVFAGLSFALRFILVYAWAVFTFCTGGFIRIVFGNNSLWDAMLSLDEYDLWHGFLVISGIIALKVILGIVIHKSEKEIAKERAASRQMYLYKIELEKKEGEKQKRINTISEAKKNLVDLNNIPHLTQSEADQMINDTANEINKWANISDYTQIGRTKALWCLKHGKSLEVALDVANHYTFKNEEKRKERVELSATVVKKYLKKY